jgi:alkylation response protein AidB-like acyl-CoA dehydrogenase
MTPSSATRIHIATHIAVDVFTSPIPAATKTSEGKTAASTIWPEVCSIRSAARAERGEAALSFISSAAKCFASDVAMEVTTNAVQLFGGAGYTVDFPVERMMRDAKITQIYEGTNQIQRVVMARALLA